uniref:Fimbrial protein n=1 Tax=Mycena chlorophos TaxID=658473 RepID=A0ABQ0L530_MYCCL|nr:fimbrial protein [Mycena chlorophos]
MKDGTRLGGDGYHAYVNPSLYCTPFAWTQIYTGIRNSPGTVPGMSNTYFSERKSVAVKADITFNAGSTTPGAASGGAFGRVYHIDETIGLTFYKYGTPKSTVDDRACFHHWYSNISGFSSYCVDIHVRVDVPTCSADASSLTLDLGRTLISSMPSVGSNTTQISPKNIHLWCENQPEIYAQFDGNTVPGRNDIFELNHNGQYAKGIGVQLLWNSLPMQKGSIYRLKSRSDDFEAYIPFSARYIRYAQQTTPGAANATIRATFTYQ